ncbi:hypothetical protein HYW17_03185 [Candidatus Uhrbacteria bacterium]|nr:hypothetical protein [Candidatus Uhrbacteria bacterium]
MIRGNGEEGCPGCHLRLEPANQLQLPDGTVVHRDKAVCSGMTGSEVGIYERLTRGGLEAGEAYRRATGRPWLGSALRSGRYPALARPAGRPSLFS